VIRVDYRNGGFHYLCRNYKKNRLVKLMWLMVAGAKDATKFWNRDTAESMAVLYAATHPEADVSVREWDGDQFKTP